MMERFYLTLVWEHPQELFMHEVTKITEILLVSPLHNDFQIKDTTFGPWLLSMFYLRKIQLYYVCKKIDAHLKQSKAWPNIFPLFSITSCLIQSY